MKFPRKTAEKHCLKKKKKKNLRRRSLNRNRARFYAVTLRQTTLLRYRAHVGTTMTTTMTAIAAPGPVKYNFPRGERVRRLAGRRRERLPVRCYAPVRKLESRFKRCMLIRDLVCAAVAPHYEDFQFYAAPTTNKYLPRQTSSHVTTAIPPPDHSANAINTSRSPFLALLTRT